MTNETREAIATERAIAEEKDLARIAVVTAARYSAAAIMAIERNDPEEAARIAAAGEAFSVLVADVLGGRPRVSLIARINGQDAEIAHTDLERVANSIRVTH